MSIVQRMALVLPLFLSSCAQTVETRVTNFHTLPPKGAGQTVSITAPAKKDSLETRQYVSVVTEHLRKYGWIPVESGKQSLSAQFDYSISAPRIVTGTAPIIGQTGGGTTYYRGNFYGNTYSSTSVTVPNYGVVGYRPVSGTVYDRLFTLKITDSSGQAVLDGKANSTGASGDLNEILPEMIKSFFQDFPGRSGVTTVRNSH